jgi:uncharacterized protein (TIGR02466 family)
MSSDIQWVGSIPIARSFWKEFDQHKNAIVDLCLRQEKTNVIESNIAVDLKQNMWESNFNFLSQPSLTELNTWMHSVTSDFVSNVNNKSHRIAITESWAHVTRPSGYHGPHRHPWSTWSGIFYVYADDPSVANNTFLNQFNMPVIPGYEFFEEEMQIEFKAGSLVIFPSTMLHYAKPYLGNDKRIVISFNSVCL